MLPVDVNDDVREAVVEEEKLERRSSYAFLQSVDKGLQARWADQTPSLLSVSGGPGSF